MDINIFLKDAYKRIKNLYNDHLVKIILYGSYARGDYKEDSDIDIMILVRCDEKEIKKRRDDIISIKSELGMEYNLYVSAIVQSVDYFNDHINVLPIFKNISKEGVEINAG